MGGGGGRKGRKKRKGGRETGGGKEMLATDYVAYISINSQHSNTHYSVHTVHLPPPPQYTYMPTLYTTNPTSS
jgi:hypothetical protein